MAAPSTSSSIVRFGPFEADLTARELRKQGRKVRLQEQPFRVLALLLQRPGEVVMREELRRRSGPPTLLWSSITGSIRQSKRFAKH